MFDFELSNLSPLLCETSFYYLLNVGGVSDAEDTN